MTGPVETKVTASTTSAALTVLVLFGISQIPGVDDLPLEVRAALLVLVTAAVTFAAGWLAPHTPRRRDGEHRAA